jgi:propionyl-CoA:succinyl-CoA transferase
MFPLLTAAEAASLIPPACTLGLSGFTAAGTPKAVPRALALRARELESRGTPMRLRLITGASTGPDVDEALAQAGAIAWRAPFQSSTTLRKAINAGSCGFVDMHLSHLPQMIEYGFLGDIDWVVVEATEITRDGRVYLTTSGGLVPTLLRAAKNVIIELNRYHPQRLCEMHDIAVLPRPPLRSPIPIHEPLSRMGTPFAVVDPAKVRGVVENEQADGIEPFDPPTDASRRIAQHVAEFLARERAAGRVPIESLPLQAGVGNLSNAVLDALGRHPDIPPFQMFTEVLQDSQAALMEAGRLTGASTCALMFSDPVMRRVLDNLDFFAPRTVIRPQELSNNPGVIRRLGVVAINTVLEFDLTGCANSTHVRGTQMMNGIGGSGDFVRNSALSILIAPSIAKGGAISTVVPMCSHVDHTEHSIQVFCTEHGLADLRGLEPAQRARTIIDTCAHPDYRDYLRRYIERCPPGHLRQDLDHVFDLHRALQHTGTMKSAL